MPKIVNHEQKKQQIIHYAWQSIVEDGAKGATVRNIAKLARMTPGQIRYYYPSHHDLLKAVALEVDCKVRGRIKAVFTDESLNPRDKVIQALLKAMPLDDERYADMEVWMAFQYELHEVGKDSMGNEIFMLVKSSMSFLEQHHLLDDSLDQYMAIVKMHALIDGLALHKWLNPEKMINQDIEYLIEHEVDSWIRR
ncbi:TetR/AcrR family transcriptional regulator [Staphylococcus edaphicus]|uniref:TetR family transcriptional regulator n=1 Tax=Staphylococcus edaphicus TaxID=1955013 RepID=A0A2C6U831_9STAP|nr:TetR/AcrR family transcriptional regulator [Staphylococcus edaphicus]PHK49962.1 TetR family transcriptional regulator [Staphylococcus edaphicus]UQW81777.1 TetR family transcriptional regulator [Staphylococcus edaphicus]